MKKRLKTAKEVLAKTDVKKDEFDKASEELNQILQTVGAAIYQQQQPGQPGPEAEATQEASTEESKKADNSKKDAEEGEVVQ